MRQLHTRILFLINLTCLCVAGCQKNATEPSGTTGLYKIAYVSITGETDIGIYLMNEDSTNRIRLTSNAATALYPEWSPDAKKLVYVQHTDSGYAVWTTNANGTNHVRISTNAGDDWDERPTWSPDGSKILFRGSSPGGIYVMNTDGSNPQRLASGNSPIWSPDGTKIAYLAGDTSQVFVMNADGANQQRLTNESTHVRYPSWSPDGSRLAFASTRNGKYEIFVVNADGTNQQRLTNNSSEDRFPIWNPAGTRIVFVSDRNGSAEVYTMQSDGSNQVRLTNNANSGFSDWFRDAHAVWSPDGSKILVDFYCGIGISVLNEDGTNQRRLTTGFDLYPAWSPVHLP